MRTVYLVFGLMLFLLKAPAQGIGKKLDVAIKQMEADSQMEHAIMTLYVQNSTTGTTVYSHNSNIGFAAASAQKVITASTALELHNRLWRPNAGQRSLRIHQS